MKKTLIKKTFYTCLGEVRKGQENKGKGGRHLKVYGDMRNGSHFS